MPTLDPENISNWYYFRDSSGNIRLFQDYTQREIQEVSDRPLLQGDIGTHVKNVGGKYFEFNFSSPVVIVETATSEGVTNAFDIMAGAFNNIRNPAAQYIMAAETQTLGPSGQFATRNSVALLKNARLKANEESTTVDLTFWVDHESHIGPEFLPIMGPLEVDFIGRVARFYDVRVFFALSGTNYISYQPLDFDIEINVDIEKKYFMGGTQAPAFAIQGYQVTGSVTLMNKPYPTDTTNTFLISDQEPGELIVGGGNIMFQVINGPLLDFGIAHMNPSVERSLKPGEVPTTKIEFSTYARYQTPLV